MSMIDGLTGQRIPGKCPKTGIDKTGESITGFRLNGSPFLPGSFHPGDEYVACDYGMPGGELTQVARGRTSGPLFYRGVQCIEIAEEQYDPQGHPLQRYRQIVHVTPRFAHTYLTLIHRRDGSGLIERTDEAAPVSVASNSRWHVQIREPGMQPVGTRERITGVYAVRIGKKTFPCMRWIRRRVSEPGQPVDVEDAEEFYISLDSGMLILNRHFIGRGWPGLENLGRSPKIEIDGAIFFLWNVRIVTSRVR